MNPTLNLTHKTTAQDSGAASGSANMNRPVKTAISQWFQPSYGSNSASRSFAFAAASRATGTLGPEQET